MKISQDAFNELSAALQPYRDAVSAALTKGHSEKPARWDALWASRFDVAPIYKAGCNDDHIDTALRKIFDHKR